MSRIEKGLHEHFASNPTEQTPAASSAGANRAGSARGQGGAAQPPFAKVNGVNPGSPASAAGLEIGDRIWKFGDADWLNNDKLAKVAQIVQQHEGVGTTSTIPDRTDSYSNRW